MAEQRKPVVIENPVEQEENAGKENGPGASRQDSHIKSSRHRLVAIASEHYIDGGLHDIEHDSLTTRAAYRQLEIKQRQQANLEQIIKLVHDLCQDEAAGSPDPDWLVRFFEMAKNIYGSAMQQLWARVLKQEILRPGSTSLKALSLLEAMTQREAQALQRACALASTFGNDSALKMVTGFRQKGGLSKWFKPLPPRKLLLGNYQLSYTDLLLLMDLGLILRTELESGEIESQPPLPLHLHGKHYLLHPRHHGSRIYYYRFSPTGNELAKLVGKRSHDAYHDALSDLLEEGFVISDGLGSTVDTKA